MLIKILYIILVYLCGSIPYAYIIAKAVSRIDIRNVGSGNPGAANVFRVIGKNAGIVTFIADTLKGFVAVYFAAFIDNSFPYYSLIASASVMLGHVFSVFLRFSGGKGIATGFGVFIALIPLSSLIVFIVFILVFMFSGYVSLGSICAAISLPITSYFFGCNAWYVAFSCVSALLVIYMHRANIKRLREGSENKLKIFGRK